LDELLRSGASEADIHATLDEFKEKHADYGKSRRSATEFHLRNIERLLKPTQTTSLVMHAIQGGEQQNAEMASSTTAETAADLTTSMSQSPPSLLDQLTQHLPQQQSSPALPTNADNFDPKALFQYLVKHLDVTPSQAAALKDSRFVSRELDACLEKAYTVLHELRERLAQTGDDLETEFTNVREILTPTQAAKFLVWVANNRACMHMLNELWDRVLPAAAPVVDTDESP
jgi:hypothetical protein